MIDVPCREANKEIACGPRTELSKLGLFVLLYSGFLAALSLLGTCRVSF